MLIKQVVDLIFYLLILNAEMPHVPKVVPYFNFLNTIFIYFVFFQKTVELKGLHFDFINNIINNCQMYRWKMMLNDAK